jgi:hypothetical protein
MGRGTSREISDGPAARAPRRVRTRRGDPLGLGAPKRPRRRPPTPAPADDAPPAQSPAHEEWLIDEALGETFRASDPISPSIPKAPEGGDPPS